MKARIKPLLSFLAALAIACVVDTCQATSCGASTRTGDRPHQGAAVLQAAPADAAFGRAGKAGLHSRLDAARRAAARNGGAGESVSP